MVKMWRHYLKDAEILLKSDAKSLQKFLAGRTDNVKLDRWVSRASRQEYSGGAHTWP